MPEAGWRAACVGGRERVGGYPESVPVLRGVGPGAFREGDGGALGVVFAVASAGERAGLGEVVRRLAYLLLAPVVWFGERVPPRVRRV